MTFTRGSDLSLTDTCRLPFFTESTHMFDLRLIVASSKQMTINDTI